MQKEKYMKEALKEAKKAMELEEIPVGAVIVKNGKIIARGYNKKELKKDATRHAEIIAIEGVEKDGLGLAIMNRLLRACSHNYIEC